MLLGRREGGIQYMLEHRAHIYVLVVLISCCYEIIGLLQLQAPRPPIPSLPLPLLLPPPPPPSIIE